MPSHEHSHSGLFGSISLVSLWQVITELLKHGPSWELIPPILGGLIGLIGVCNIALNDREKRRQARAKFDAELTRAALDAAARWREPEHVQAALDDAARRRANDSPSRN